MATRYGLEVEVPRETAVSRVDRWVRRFHRLQVSAMAKVLVSLIPAIQTSPFDGETREQSAGTISSKQRDFQVRKGWEKRDQPLKYENYSVNYP